MSLSFVKRNSKITGNIYEKEIPDDLAIVKLTFERLMQKVEIQYQKQTWQEEGDDEEDNDDSYLGMDLFG